MRLKDRDKWGISPFVCKASRRNIFLIKLSKLPGRLRTSQGNGNGDGGKMEMAIRREIKMEAERPGVKNENRP